MKSALVYTDLLFLFFFAVSSFAAPLPAFAVIVPAVLLIFHVAKIMQYKASVEICFLMIFSATYPVYWLISVLMEVEIHYFFSYINSSYVAKAFSAQGVFLASMFLSMRGAAPAVLSRWKIKDDRFVFYVCIAGMLACLAISLATVEGSVFEKSYDYESSDSSILFEYVLILLLLGYLYAGDSVSNRVVLIGMAFFFVIAPLYFGKRLPASMVAFAMLLLFYRPRGLKQVAFIFSAGFVALSGLALFRVGESGGTLMSILFNISDSGVMRNNQGGVIYSSAAYMKLVDDGVFDFDFGIRSFSNVVLSIFVPSKYVDEAAFINFSAMNYIPIPGNGGFPGVTFYVWGGLAGVMLFGLLVGWVFLRSNRGYAAAVYATFLLVTFPRWLAYNVNIMFKAGLLLLIGFFIIRLLSKVSRSSS